MCPPERQHAGFSSRSSPTATGPSTRGTPTRDQTRRTRPTPSCPNPERRLLILLIGVAPLPGRVRVVELHGAGDLVGVVAQVLLVHVAVVAGDEGLQARISVLGGP